MSEYLDEADYQHGAAESTGILLVNLGTPDAPTTGAVRRYLKEFLWDPRVVEVPRALWWLILNGVILNIRPRRSAKAYESVWTNEGSPLLAISRRQTQALDRVLQKQFPGTVRLALGMRYGKPSIRAGLEALRREGARRLLVLPLYPQYSATTTGSVFDAVADALKTWRWVPELRIINHYHDDPAHIAALAACIRRHWESEGRGQLLLFSFHGIPKRYFLNGDPYYCHCQKTARLTAEALGLEEGEWRVTFQSRVGREEWLQPYTDKTMKALPGEGITALDVVCPGFAADCLETLEEIAVENREYFLGAGGERYRYIPALNDDPAHIDALLGLILRHLQGWPEIDSDWNAQAASDEAQARLQRAQSLGAKR